MKKEDLLALGLTEEQVEKVLAALGGQYVEKAQFDALEGETRTLRESVAERDKQLEGLKKGAGDIDTLKAQIEQLQADNAAKDEAHAAELSRVKIDSAVDQALAAAKAKNVTAVKALLNLQDAKLSEDGGVAGLQEQIDKLVAGEDTGFLFERKAQAPTFTGFQPGVSAMVPDSKSAGYETRLAEARKSGSTLDIIKIKQEAAAEGIALL